MCVYRQFVCFQSSGGITQFYAKKRYILLFYRISNLWIFEKSISVQKLWHHLPTESITRGGFKLCMHAHEYRCIIIINFGTRHDMVHYAVPCHLAILHYNDTTT